MVKYGLNTFFYILFILSFSLFLTIDSFSQRVSRDNYTGNWENPSSWNPTWPTPQTSGISINITIYGKITRNGDLSFDGPSGNLIIYDTLIINGNLDMGNNNDIIVHDGGVLIITGNLTVANQVNISANSYIVIFGNFTKSGAANQGSFTSNDQPANVYIGGTISTPTDWASTNPNDVFNCKLPIEHENTQCNYGNFIDIQESPIIDLVQTVCTSKPIITQQPTNKTCCVNQNTSFTLTATNVATYQWQIWTGTKFDNLTNNSTYSGVNSNTLVINSVTQSMNGNIYRCVLRSSNNCITISNQVTLTVTTGPTTGPIYHLPSN